MSALAAALALLAGAPSASAAPTQAAPKAQTASETTEKQAAAADCKAEQPSTDQRTIVICAQKPNGYRLNPDVMEATREVKSGGRPRSPYPQAPRPDCASVGPAPCTSAGINLIGLALTAAEMAKRVAEGKEIGSMFQTDPHPSEYQLYLMAKSRREAAEGEKAAAAAKAKAEKAKSDAPQPQASATTPQD